MNKVHVGRVYMHSWHLQGFQRLGTEFGFLGEVSDFAWGLHIYTMGAMGVQLSPKRMYDIQANTCGF